MRIIITGASGFVGSNLSNYLQTKKKEIEKISLRGDYSINKNANAIIHLAGKAHDTADTSDEKTYFQINTELTKEVFKKFLNSDIKYFFFFSSVKASADTLDSVLDEKHHSLPQTPYGKSKLMAEEYLLSQELSEGKKVYIIRPTMIHGKGNKGNLNLLYKIVDKGVPWPLASFENKRSFLSIDNLNYLVLEMLKKDVPSGIYNFSDDHSISTNELIKIIAKASRRKPKLWKISVGFIRFIAKIGDKISLPLNSERLKKLTESYIVSNKKVKQVLGIEKLPLTATQGLTKTIKSFKND